MTYAPPRYLTNARGEPTDVVVSLADYERLWWAYLRTLEDDALDEALISRYGDPAADRAENLQRLEDFEDGVLLQMLRGKAAEREVIGTAISRNEFEERLARFRSGLGDATTRQPKPSGDYYDLAAFKSEVARTDAQS